jgi:hypothetical protein
MGRKIRVAAVLRYPERDAVVIVLRNGYGSTERLEENLQAILFGAPPKMPSRSMKDSAAQMWLIPVEWVQRHVWWAVALFIVVVLGGPRAGWHLRPRK